MLLEEHQPASIGLVLVFVEVDVEVDVDWRRYHSLSSQAAHYSDPRNPEQRRAG